jgi:hypothetical protein
MVNLVETGGGGGGGVTVCVVALTVFDAPERFPAASRAFTVYEYAVEAERPVSLYEVPVGDATSVPFLKTW